MAGTREIPLSNGGVALVDEQDYDLVMSYGVWYKSDTGYVVRRYNSSTLRMHRLIMNPDHRLFVDHINRDKLDNRRANLRMVSHAQNCQNGSGETKTVYKDLPKGVTFDYTRNKYLATYQVRRRFSTLDEAIKFTKGE